MIMPIMMSRAQAPSLEAVPASNFAHRCNVLLWPTSLLVVGKLLDAHYDVFLMGPLGTLAWWQPGYELAMFLEDVPDLYTALSEGQVDHTIEIHALGNETSMHFKSVHAQAVEIRVTGLRVDATPVIEEVSVKDLKRAISLISKQFVAAGKIALPEADLNPLERIVRWIFVSPE